MKRTFEGWVETEVPLPQILIDDRPYLPRPGILGKSGSLVPKFHGQACAHRPMPRFRSAHARTNVIAYPLISIYRTVGGEYVEADFRPGVEALRNFHCLVPGVPGGVNPVDLILLSADCEIAVQLDHRPSRRYRLRPIDLDFVVLLCSYMTGKQDGKSNKR